MSVLDILNMIYNEKLKQNILDIDISKALNISPGSVSNYFSGKIRIPFLSFVKLVELVYQGKTDKQKQLITTFCNATDKPENLRIAMEFANVNHELDLLSFLINKEEDSHNKANIEWSSIYELLYLRRKNGITNIEYKDLLIERTKKSLSKEMKVLSKIAMMYLYLDLNEYNSLLKLMDGIFDEISDISNNYVRESYHLKAKEIVVVANLMRSNIKESRDHALMSLNEDYSLNYPITVASTIHWLAQSYMNDDPHYSLNLVERAVKVLETRNSIIFNRYINALRDTSDFIKIYWNMELNSITPRSVSELAHLLCKRGEKNEAINIYKQIEKENGKLSNFEKFYLSECIDDEELKTSALNGFESEGKYFYIELLKNEKFL